MPKAKAKGSIHKQPRVAAAKNHATRRRGSGISHVAKTFDIFFGNVTSMSDKAKQCLSTVKDAMWLAGETHILQNTTT